MITSPRSGRRNAFPFALVTAIQTLSLNIAQQTTKHFPESLATIANALCYPKVGHDQIRSHSLGCCASDFLMDLLFSPASFAPLGQNVGMARRRTRESAALGSRPVQERKWEEKYQELILFKESHGHCRVPQKDPRLGRWCNWQRVQRKECDDGKEKMTDLLHDRWRKLDRVGFPWSIDDARWESRMAALQRYFGRYRRRPPITCAIGRWLAYQLRAYHDGLRYVYRDPKTGTKTRLPVSQSRADALVLAMLANLFTPPEERPRAAASAPPSESGKEA